MAHRYDYDMIAIGSGSAGGSAAFVAKRAGMRVAVVEEFKDRLGGHCPNYACVPTKAWLKAAEIYKMTKRAHEFGVTVPSAVMDFQKFAAYRDEVIGTLTGPRIERNLHNAGIDLLWGKAQFVSEHELMIGNPSDGSGKKYSFNHAVIGTGSKEFIPPIPGLAEAGFWTSDIAARAGDLPESFVVIGGGPIGTEFTEVFTSFDRPVTILQREPQILQREDKEVAEYLQHDLEKRGVRIILNCEIEEVTRVGSYKIVRGKSAGQEFNAEGAEILVATGRRASLDLNLEAAGVKLTPQGRLDINEYLQTTVSHIWAAGDAAGNWQFTHTAAYEGDLVGRNICHRHDEKTNYDVVPRVTFCDPEVASVGITEAQARLQNLHVKISKFPVGGLGRYLINRDKRGFVKLVVDAKTNLVLGGHVVGESAGQLVHEIALAMKGKIKITDVAKMIHAYPTFSEAVGAAAEKFLEIG